MLFNVISNKCSTFIGLYDSFTPKDLLLNQPYCVYVKAIIGVQALAHVHRRFFEVYLG